SNCWTAGTMPRTKTPGSPWDRRSSSASTASPPRCRARVNAFAHLEVGPGKDPFLTTGVCVRRLTDASRIDLTARHKDPHVAQRHKHRLPFLVSCLAVLLPRQFGFKDNARVAALHFQTHDGA